MRRIQLHPTSMELLSKCGIAFERRYLNNERSPHSARSAIGTAVDRSVGSNLTEKKNTAHLLPLEAVKDIARDALVRVWDGADGEPVRVTEEDQEDALSNRDKAIDASVDLAGFHHDEVAPLIEPVHIARKWVLDIEGLDLQLAGEIDIQTPNAIRDTKTSGKSPVKTLAHESMQLTAYAMAANVVDGIIPSELVLDYVVRTAKRQDLKYVPLTTIRTAEHFGPLLARIQKMAEIIQTGQFTPAPPSAWYCSSRYCSFWNTCPYASKPVSIALPEVSDDLAAKLEASIAAKK
jgi:hypothetical protein